jgi:hypothetical protein
VRDERHHQRHASLDVASVVVTNLVLEHEVRPPVLVDVFEVVDR